MDKDIRLHLEELGMHPNEIKIYMALASLGEAPASVVAKKANVPRTTAISVLEKFKKENLISLHRYHGITYYWIESPRILSESFMTKAGIAEDLARLFSDFYRSEAAFPFAEVHDTKSGIRAFIEKTLANLKQGSVICTIDAPREGNYNKIYSENIEHVLLAQKRKKGILTHTLVPYGITKDIPPQKLKIQSIVIRELPPAIEFHASLWVIGDTLMHFSGNPPFVVAVRHKGIVDGMKSIFDFFWARAEGK